MGEVSLMSCQGICATLPNISKARNRSIKLEDKTIKADGIFLKKCTVCVIVIKTNDIRCPCCKHILRTKVRGRKIRV